MLPERSVLLGRSRSRPRMPSTCPEVYFDCNASAPVDPRVAADMVAALIKRSGNASSTHRFGQSQAAAVDSARQAGAERGFAKNPLVPCLIRDRPDNDVYWLRRPLSPNRGRLEWR